MIAVRFGAVMSHYGVVTSRGTVLTNSRVNGGVTEQSIDVFAKGRPLRLCQRVDSLEAVAVETRARRAIGSEYNLLGSNCSQYARWTHRRKPSMLQRAAGTAMAVRDMFSRRV